MDSTKAQETRGIFGFLAKHRVLAVFNAIFWQTDTATIRIVMGLASFLWGVCLALNPTYVTKWPYMLLDTIAPSFVWSTLFFLHSLGVLWRLLDPVPRVNCALVINASGLALWLTVTLCINLTIGKFVPGSSMEVIVCLFGAWTLFRTGIGKDAVTP